MSSTEPLRTYLDRLPIRRLLHDRPHRIPDSELEFRALLQKNTEDQIFGANVKRFRLYLYGYNLIRAMLSPLERLDMILDKNDLSEEQLAIVLKRGADTLAVAKRTVYRELGISGRVRTKTRTFLVPIFFEKKESVV